MFSGVCCCCSKSQLSPQKPTRLSASVLRSQMVGVLLSTIRGADRFGSLCLYSCIQIRHTESISVLLFLCSCVFFLFFFFFFFFSCFRLLLSDLRCLLCRTSIYSVLCLWRAAAALHPGRFESEIGVTVLLEKQAVSCVIFSDDKRSTVLKYRISCLLLFISKLSNVDWRTVD